MKKHRYTFSILFISIIICLLNSCNNNDVDKLFLPNPEVQINLTSQEYASIAFDNPKELSESDVIKILDNFVKSKEEKEFGKFATKNTTISISYDVKTKYYYNIGEKSSESTRSSNEEENIPIYEINILNGDQKGIALVSADERAQKVIAYIPAIDEDERLNNPNALYLEEVAKRSLINNISEINHLKDSLRAQTLQKIGEGLNINPNNVNFDDVKNYISVNDEPISKFKPIQVPPSQVLSAVLPMCTTSWNQTSPYNCQLPVGNVEGYPYPTNYYAGCGVIALAQVVAFLEPVLTVYTTTINWGYLKENQYIYNSDPVEKRNMVGNLIKYIYVHALAYPVYNSEGYVTGVATSESSIEGCMKIFAHCDSRRSWDSDIVRNSLLANRPVITFGTGTRSDGSTVAHAFVLDGYLLCKLYYGAMAASIDTDTKELVKLYDLYFHANLGWGGNSSGYYLINKDTSVDFETSGSTYKSGNLRILPNIRNR